MYPAICPKVRLSTSALSVVLGCLTEYTPQPTSIGHGVLQNVFANPAHLQLADYPQTAVAFKADHHVRDFATEPWVCDARQLLNTASMPHAQVMDIIIYPMFCIKRNYTLISPTVVCSLGRYTIGVIGIALASITFIIACTFIWLMIYYARFVWGQFPI